MRTGFFSFGISGVSSVILSLSLLLFLRCGEAGKTDLPLSGIARDLADGRAERFGDIAYDLRLRVPLGLEEEIRGRIVISFSAKDISNPLVLDFDAPPSHLLSVRSDGRVIPYDFVNGHIVVAPAHLKAGGNSFDIDFIAGEAPLNRHKDYLYSLFVPAQASKSFPCFDQPNMKARFSLEFKVPKGWEAISNGRVERKLQEGDEVSYTFAETSPIPTYLFAFTAGEFQVLHHKEGGRELTLYHRETDSLKLGQNVDEIFRLHGMALEWMEEYTGIDMPFPDFKLVLIPAFQFGGMEHPGAVYYKASSLLLSSTASSRQRLKRANLIAHETAHLWFGDLVTMEWFDDVWLKEVFANFMAAKIVNPSFPDMDHEVAFNLSHFPGAYDIDRSEGSHAIRQDLPNLNDAGTLYGGIIYHKAPIVLRNLEQVMGQNALKKGLGAYLKKYAYDNATWDDLIAALRPYAALDLDRWSEAWIKTPGRPGIRYELRPGTGIQELQVHQSVDDRNMSFFWPQKIRFLSDGEVGSHTYEIDMSEEGHFSLDSVRGKKVFPNSDGRAYGHFSLDSCTRHFLLDSISEVIPAVTRASLWMTLWEEVLEGRIPPHDWLKALEKALPQEREPMVLDYLVSRLGFCYWHWLGPQERKALAPRLEGMLLSMVLNSPDSGVKAIFYRGFYTVAITQHGIDVLHRLWRGDLALESFELEEEDKITLAYELAIRGMDSVLEEQLRQVRNPDRKARMAFVMQALSQDESQRDAFFESLKSVDNRRNESWVLEAVRYLHHPLRRKSAMKYIKPSLVLLEEIQATGDIFFPKRWLDGTLGGHSSRDAANVVRQFLRENDDYPLVLERKVLQSADLLFRTVEIRQGHDEKKMLN